MQQFNGISRTAVCTRGRRENLREKQKRLKTKALP
jgi:hypothetical protein